MNKNHKRFPLGISIGLAFALLASLGLIFHVFGTTSRAVSDRFFLPRQASQDIVIVEINDESINKIGRWPWKRSVHAKLIRILAEAGARAIAFDVNFSEPSVKEEDEALGQAIKNAGNVILPMEIKFLLTKTGESFDEAHVVTAIPDIRNGAQSSGFSNTPLDSDGIVRRVPLFVEGNDGMRMYSFAYEATRLSDQAPSIQTIPFDGNRRMIISFPDSPRKAFRMISAIDVLDGKVDAKILNDKTVFVGATARDLHDEQSVPTSAGHPMSGVEIHASIFDTLAQKTFLREVPIAWHISFFIVIGILLGFAIPRVRARTGFLLTAGTYLGWLVVAFLLFDQGWILDIVWIGIFLTLAYLALLIERWITTEHERKKTRNAFSRYVSANVVESIMQQADDLKLGGSRRNMTVLFSDLRGFTTLSEGLRPEELVFILNTYLHEMTSIVFEEGGVLDKYIGDAVMAFWNAPFDQADHAARAVRTAIKMKEKLQQMNEKKVFGKEIELRVGIGMNTGEMVVGNIGGEQRYDYTVIGDSVNTASRTEGLCKPYGVEIIVTEFTKAKLDQSFIFRKLDRVAVKGKTEPIRIYEVLGFESNVSDKERKFALRYEEALNVYFERNFEKARKLCKELLNRKSTDLSTKQLLNRAEVFIKNPPPKDWDGVWVLTSK